jgi:phosphatidylinositol glycan class M
MLLSIGGGFWLASALPSSDHLPTPSATQTATSVQLNSQKRQNHVAGSQHLPFIFLIQTLVFVTLNKVCTSQYFMWYLWFLPLVVPHLIPRNVPNKTVATDAEQEKTTDRGNVEANGVSAYKAAWMIGLWVGSQALWLSQGYRLEFLGETVFVPLWAAGIVMLGVNSWLVSCLLKGYQIQ